MINRLAEQLLGLPRPAKRLLALCVDALVCVLCVCFALSLRFEQWMLPRGSQWWAAAIAALIALPLFTVFGLYRAIFRYAGAPAVLAILRACALFGLAYAALFTVVGISTVPRTVGLVVPLLLFMCIGGLRMLARYWLGGMYMSAVQRKSLPQVVIYGAGGAGLVFWRSLPPSRHFAVQPFEWRVLRDRFAGVFRDAGLPWLFAEGFLLLGAFVTVYNFIGYRLLAPPYGLSQAVVGLIFSVYLIGTFSSAWMGHLAGKLGRRKVLWTAFALMLAGVLLTLTSPLVLIVLGIVAITFGFFGGHSIASSWVGRRAGAAKAQASSMYLFSYYMGSSLAGAGGGLFYASYGWNGVAAFVGLLVIGGLSIAWRLRGLVPLPGPPSKGDEPPLAEV